MRKTRVVIADDHAILRSGLRLLINEQPDMEVVGEAASGEEALRQSLDVAPDVLTMDVTMPGSPYTDSIRCIAAQCPQTKVLVLTMHDDPAYLRQALSAGASGFVVKRADSHDLLAAVRALAAGRTFVDVGFQQALPSTGAQTGTAARQQPAQLVDRLSAREREVLILLAGGHTNQEIADRVYLSVKTIETYRYRIGEKIGRRTRAEMTRFAFDSGLIAWQAGLVEPAVENRG